MILSYCYRLPKANFCHTVTVKISIYCNIFKLTQLHCSYIVKITVWMCYLIGISSILSYKTITILSNQKSHHSYIFKVILSDTAIEKLLIYCLRNNTSHIVTITLSIYCQIILSIYSHNYNTIVLWQSHYQYNLTVILSL